MFGNYFPCIISVSQLPECDEHMIHQGVPHATPEQEQHFCNQIGDVVHHNGNCETSSANVLKEQSLKKPKMGVIQKFSVVLSRIFKANL